MHQRISESLEGNPWELLADNWPYIVHWVPTYGKHMFKGFENINDSLEHYADQEVSNRTLYLLNNISPRLLLSG